MLTRHAYRSLSENNVDAKFDHRPVGVVCSSQPAVTVTVTPTVTRTVTFPNIFNEISSSAQLVRGEGMSPVTVTVTVLHAIYLADISSAPNEATAVEAPKVEPATAAQDSTETVVSTVTRTSTVEITLSPDHTTQGTRPIFDPCHLTDVNGYAPPCIEEKAKKAETGPDGKKTVTYKLDDNTTRNIRVTSIITNIRTVTVVPLQHAPSQTTDTSAPETSSSKSSATASNTQTEESGLSTRPPKRTTAVTLEASYDTLETNSETPTSTPFVSSDGPKAQEASSKPAVRTPSAKISFGFGGWNGTVLSAATPLPLSDWHTKYFGGARSSGTAPSRAAQVPAHMPWDQ